MTLSLRELVFIYDTLLTSDHKIVKFFEFAFSKLNDLQYLNQLFSAL